jgi:hypothetical protein
MFYKKGLDIANTKEMFEFLKNHFEYYTMNSWNGLSSIANNVKVHRLGLEGDCWTALSLLQADDYFNVNMMIEDWEADHPCCSVGFNGRSGGYLVLYRKNGNGHVLPDMVTDYDSYEDFKEACKEYYGGVKYYKNELRDCVELVRDFDRLCDDIRSYVNYLSKQSFEKLEMEKAVDLFNETYAEDLEYLGYSELELKEDGSVDISEIQQLISLTEAFINLASRKEEGYYVSVNEGIARLEER